MYNVYNLIINITIAVGKVAACSCSSVDSSFGWTCAVGH